MLDGTIKYLRVTENLIVVEINYWVLILDAEMWIIHFHLHSSTRWILLIWILEMRKQKGQVIKAIEEWQIQNLSTNIIGFNVCHII